MQEDQAAGSTDGLLDKPYPAWTSDDVWSIFVRLIERDVPDLGVGRRLADYRALFDEVYERIKCEHAAVLGTHFRKSRSEPFVNPLNIEHLTRLTHQFAHALYGSGASEVLLDALFFVIRSRCQINLFYKQPVRPFFFAFHAIGAVLGYGTYGRFLVVTQATTIGQNHNRYPVLGDCVLLAPGATVLGDSKIGDNVLIGAGAIVIDQNIPDNTVVLGRPPNQSLRPNSRDNREINFDLEMLSQMGKA